MNDETKEIISKYGNPVLPQIMSVREENDLIESAVNTLISFLFEKSKNIEPEFAKKVRNRLFQHLLLKYGAYPEKFNEFLVNVKANKGAENE